MKKLFYLIFTIFIFSCNNNYKKIIFSPDNKIQVFISTKNNELTYSIKKDERSVIKTSKLGIVLKDNIDLTKKFKIISFNSKTHSELLKTIIFPKDISKLSKGLPNPRYEDVRSED